jgi:hypothetical protein
MTVSQWTDHVQTGDHASRPAASATAVDALYSCTDHGHIYQSNGVDTWADWYDPHDNLDDGVIAVILDTPTADDQLDVVIPFTCVITDVTLLADVSGSIVVDIWKDTYANFPPVVGDAITNPASYPTLSTAIKSVDSTLTGWTTALTEGDTLRFNVNSAATVTRVLLSLGVIR